MIDISIVIPLYNDQEVIPLLTKRLSSTLKPTPLNYQIIFVNDGSADETERVLKENIQVLSFTNVIYIDLMRNFGQMAAIEAGIEKAKGKYCVLMDSDLQDRPEDIHKLHEHLLKTKSKLVIAGRKSRIDHPLKKLASKLFSRVSQGLTNISFPRNTGVFRIFETTVFQKILKSKDSTTPPLSLMIWSGMKYNVLLLDRDARAAGTSGYDLSKMFSLAFDRILSYSTTPIRLATYAGIFFGLTSIITISYLVIKKLIYGGIVPGWTTTVSLILLSTSMNLTFLGIIGEYLSRIYKETKGRPRFLIQETIEFKSNSHVKKVS